MVKFNKFIIALAPMAGVTDFAFRKICSDFGADMVVTEMISLKAIQHKSTTSEKMLREESDCLRVCQLFFHEPQLADIIPSVKQLEHFDFIDLNCGCPAPKIVKNNEGSAMMRDLNNTRAVISNLVKNSPKPVSVKFRLGIDNLNNYIEFAKMCQECGVSFLTLHARTKEQGYSGSVDKEAYSKLVKAVNIPVLWSGDISNIDDIIYAKSIGCAGVMIGRQALGNPEIFSSLKGITPPYSKKEVATKHLNLLKTYFKTEQTLVAYFKKHLMWYAKAMQNTKALRYSIMQFSTIKELEKVINTF